MNRTSEPGKRRIRSFVRREGRLTPGQQRALDKWLPEFGLPAGEGEFDFEALFGRKAPTVLEIGFGNGDTLFELAQRHPEWNFIGLEVHRPGVGHLLKQVGEAGLTNVRVGDDDAVEVLRHRIPAQSLHRVLLYFPDPWPKKRHHKRRIVQADFTQLVASRLAPGGEFHLATDWEPYAEWMHDVLQAESALENTAADGGFVPRPDERPETKFERRGHRLGHDTWDLVYRRR